MKPLVDVMLEVRWMSPRRHYRLHQLDHRRQWWVGGFIGIRRGTSWYNPAFYICVLGLQLGIGLLFEKAPQK